jgi:hypothetical protein
MALDLTSGRARHYYTVRQADLSSDWLGCFAFDGDTLYLGTYGPPSAIYRVEDNTPKEVYVGDDEPITGMAFRKPGHLYFTSGGTKVFAQKEFRRPILATEVASGTLRGLAFAPPSRAGESRISGTVAGPQQIRELFHIVLVGPNFFWNDHDWASHGARRVSASGRYSITNLPAGKYWISVDTGSKVDWQARPGMTEVICSGRTPAKANFYLRGAGYRADVCSQKPDGGPGKALFDRYYFDGTSCKRFTWGGVEGVVPFETLEECRAACE